MNHPRQIAVVLSGCGHLDGSEITEAVSTLIALGQAGAQYRCFAPALDALTCDHLSHQTLTERRNTLVEAARITRGQVQELGELDPEKFDAVILPGGMGAAQNLSNWVSQGAKCKLHPEVERVLLDFYKQNKPIGAFCIAPTLVAKALGSHGVTVTIGNDPETAREIEKTGAQHETCEVEDFLSDREHKIVTSPAYMFDARPDQVFTGISRAVKEIVEMA